MSQHWAPDMKVLAGHSVATAPISIPRQLAGDGARVDVGQLVKPRVPVGSEDGAASDAGSGGHDEVMGASSPAFACGGGQQSGMVLGHRSVICADRCDGEDVGEKCPLCRGAG